MIKKGEKKRRKKVLHTIFIAFAIVAFWRGVWGLMDIYLLPNQPEFSFWISIFIGIIILIYTESLIERLV
jgi:hypothetical protein